MIDADADMAAIMNAGDFTQNVVVAGQTIKGDFTDATDAVSVLDGQVEATRPTLMCATADVENVTRGAAVTVNSRSFTVERIERVGQGLNVLYLKT
jgi:hypothetical protein